MGEVQPPFLAARLPRLPRVLLRLVLHGAALDEADRGRRRLGAGDGRRHPAPDPRHRLARRGRDPCPVRLDRLPDPDHPGRPRTRSPGRCVATPWPRRSPAHAWSRWPAPATSPTPATRSWSTCSSASSSHRSEGPRHDPRDAHVDPIARAPPPGPVHLVADRPRARPARRRHRRRAADAAAGPGDRLARPAPRHGGARDARRTDPPAERGARLGIGPHRGRVVGSRPQRLPGDPTDGRDPRRELHGLPRRRRRPANTTSSSATKRGMSTISSTRTRSSSGPRSRG